MSENKTTKEDAEDSRVERLLILSVQEQRKIRLLLQKQKQSVATRQQIQTVRLLGGVLMTVSLTAFFTISFQNELDPAEFQVLFLFLVIGGICIFISVITP